MTLNKIEELFVHVLYIHTCSVVLLYDYGYCLEKHKTRLNGSLGLLLPCIHLYCLRAPARASRMISIRMIYYIARISFSLSLCPALSL
jgi:hypothetical protein